MAEDHEPFKHSVTNVVIIYKIVLVPKIGMLPDRNCCFQIVDVQGAVPPALAEASPAGDMICKQKNRALISRNFSRSIVAASSRRKDALAGMPNSFNPSKASQKY